MSTPTEGAQYTPAPSSSFITVPILHDTKGEKSLSTNEYLMSANTGTEI